MPLIKLPYFGQIDPTSLEEYYNVGIPFQDKEIQIDLNFDNKTIDPKRLDLVKHFIENIRIYDLNNKGYISNDYNNEEGDTVKSYLEHHLEELGQEELSKLIDLNSKTSDHKNQLLKRLHLIRVGIYPDNATLFATFDYSIGQEMTNELVAIFTDENGNFDGMAIES